jgi:hypothetical protein
MEMSSTTMHNMEAPLAGRKRRGQSIDIETGDLISGSHVSRNTGVIKRNIMGHIINHIVENDDEIR